MGRKTHGGEGSRNFLEHHPLDFKEMKDEVIAVHMRTFNTLFMDLSRHQIEINDHLLGAQTTLKYCNWRGKQKPKF